MNWRFTSGLFVLAAWAWCPSAYAAPVPFAARIEVGRPAKPAAVSVTNATNGVEIVVGTTRHTLDGLVATAVETERVVLLGGGVIGAIWVDAAPGRHLVLVGRRHGKTSVIWIGITGLRGDPGERRGHVLVQLELGGNHEAEVGIAETHDAARDCGGAKASIRAQWVNPSTLDLSPTSHLVTLPRDATADQGVRLDASPIQPAGMRERPILQVLRARWSTGPDGDPLAQLPTGGALLDGNRELPWIAGDARDARVVMGILGSGLHVTHLAFTVAATTTPQGRTLLLRGDGGGWFHVTLPTEPAADGRYWVSLPEAAAWSCLELAAASSSGATLGMPSITEIEAFTELDQPGGIVQLVARVVTDDQHGTDAANLLMSIGEAGVSALRSQWDRLGSRGQRRAIVALSTRASDSAAARTALLLAASAADPDVSARALAALVSNSRVAFVELARLAESPGTVGATAAQAVGASGNAEAVRTLLALIAAPAGSERADLRDALGIALARTPGAMTDEAVATWIQSEPTTAALAAALRVLATTERAHPDALGLWHSLSAETLDFPALWRTLLATRSLGPSDDVDEWLVRQASTGGAAWMLRDAALASLQVRNSGRAISAALHARNDVSPRVRATAIAILGSTPEQRQALAASLSDEPWPLARVALVHQLAGVSGVRSILRRALTDRAIPVRAAAISALAHASDRSAWPAVAARLRDNDESPTVMSAAIQFAVTLCITDATDGLRTVLRRGLKPDTWAPDVDLALEAIVALGQIATDDARRLLTALQSPEQPAMVRETAKRAANGPTCAPDDGTATPTTPTTAETSD